MGCLLAAFAVLLTATDATTLSDDLWIGNLLAPRFAIASLLQFHIRVPLQNGLAMPLVFLLAYVLVRRKWLAGLILMLFMLMPIGGALVFRVVGASLFTVMVVRFGVLTTTSFFFAMFVLEMYPMTTDLSLWYAGRTLFAVALVAALGFYGLRTSLAGQRLFGSRLLDWPEPS